jgi:hypothetical protein
MYKNGPGKWACAVKGREQGKRQYHADPQKFNEKARAWRLRNPGRTKAQNARVRFEVYDAFLNAQEGRCAICQKEPHEVAVRWNTLCIDHNHGTGWIRGLLCLHCNALLGMAKDDPDLLLRAIYYLETDGLEDVPGLTVSRIKTKKGVS